MLAFEATAALYYKDGVFYPDPDALLRLLGNPSKVATRKTLSIKESVMTAAELRKYLKKTHNTHVVVRTFTGQQDEQNIRRLFRQRNKKKKRA
jgi:hypothetical protein